MSNTSVLRVDGLSVHVGARALLRDIHFELPAGSCLTLVGESGAGKSLLAQAIMGNLPAGLHAQGDVTLQGVRTPAQNGQARRPLWGRALALLPQEPSLALDPLMRLAPQLAEVHQRVGGRSASQARAAAAETLRAVGLGDAARHYPWQVSGGMAQRATAAMALAGGARVLLADEPTKGLDRYWQDQTIASLQALMQAGGAVIVITHDLRVARALRGQLMVLKDGAVVEQGDTASVLQAPQHDFTRRLVAADPARWPRRPAPPLGDQVLQATGLRKCFGERVLFDGLDLSLQRGERLVIQGPSGIGKSTLGNVLLGLHPADAGAITRAPGLPMSGLQKLFQDPGASFAPRATLERSLRDVAALHQQPWASVLRTLDKLRLPHTLLRRHPHQVSGGELQRMALARVLLAKPALIFADEPTSRLDPITQQETLDVLLDETQEANAALLLVTHDEDIARAVHTRLFSPWTALPTSQP